MIGRYGYVYDASRTLREETVAEMKIKDVVAELKSRRIRDSLKRLLMDAKRENGTALHPHTLADKSLEQMLEMVHVQDSGVDAKAIEAVLAEPPPQGTADELRARLLHEFHKDEVAPLPPITLRTSAREFYKNKKAEAEIAVSQAEAAKAALSKARNEKEELQRKFAEEIQKMKAIEATEVQLA